MQATSPVRRTDISNEGISTIARILSYRNDDVIGRYAEDHRLPLEIAERGFHAFKQFSVANVFVDGIKTPSQEIDNVWHIFALYMRQYEEFCKEYLGGMVYHDPGKDDAGMEFYPMTRACAEELCGPLDARYWPEDHDPHPKSRCISCSVTEKRFS